jgi:hypothetical protein
MTNAKGNRESENAGDTDQGYGNRERENAGDNDQC